jgi:hypothetical protein
VLENGLVVICDASSAECIEGAYARLGLAQVTKHWQGVADDGTSAKVTELFYAPRLAAMGNASSFTTPEL